jgi:hypothetical protein
MIQLPSLPLGSYQYLKIQKYMIAIDRGWPSSWKTRKYEPKHGLFLFIVVALRVLYYAIKVGLKKKSGSSKILYIGGDGVFLDFS